MENSKESLQIFDGHFLNMLEETMPSLLKTDITLKNFHKICRFLMVLTQVLYTFLNRSVGAYGKSEVWGRPLHKCMDFFTKISETRQIF